MLRIPVLILRSAPPVSIARAAGGTERRTTGRVCGRIEGAGIATELKTFGFRTNEVKIEDFNIVAILRLVMLVTNHKTYFVGSA